jgi:hypothetical protein
MWRVGGKETTMSAFPQEFPPQGTNNDAGWNQLEKLLGQGFANSISSLFDGKKQHVQTIENIILNLAFESFVSLDATCAALAINNIVYKLGTSRNVNVRELKSQQISDANAFCTSDTYYPTRNANVAATFEAFAKAMVPKEDPSSSPSSSSAKEQINIIESLASILRAGMFQGCVSTAYNTVAVQDLGSNNNISVPSAAQIYQDAEADVQNCISTMVSGDTTFKDQVAKFAALNAASTPPGTFESGLAGCAMQYYWKILAIGAFVMFIILLGLLYVARKHLL